MKKTCIYSIFFLGLSFFFSCSDDDNSPENMDFAELIIGEWETTSKMINGVLAEGPCDTGELFVFRSDGTFDTGFWADDSMCAGIFIGGDYNINGSIIEFSNTMSDPFDADIVTLTTSTLVYKYDTSGGEIMLSYSK